MASIEFNVKTATTAEITANKRANMLTYDSTIDGMKFTLTDGTTTNNLLTLDSSYDALYAIGTLQILTSSYIGLGAAKGRILFTDAATDTIAIKTANLDVDSNSIINAAAINSATGANITIKTGDNGGTNKISLTDSGDAEVAKWDSNGKIFVDDIQTFTNNAILDIHMTDTAANNVPGFYVKDSLGALEFSLTTGGNGAFAGTLYAGGGSFAVNTGGSQELTITPTASEGVYYDVSVGTKAHRFQDDVYLREGTAGAWYSLYAQDITADGDFYGQVIGTGVSNNAGVLNISTTGAANDISLYSGKDVLIRLADNAGANKITIEDSTPAEIASIDSDGNMQLDGSVEIDGDLNHDGTNVGFYGTAPVSQRTKAAHNNWAAFTDVVDALVELGLFDAA